MAVFESHLAKTQRIRMSQKMLNTNNIRLLLNSCRVITEVKKNTCCKHMAKK